MALAALVTRKIRAIREGLGLSRERLAELSGVPYRTIQNAEAPNGNPTVETLEGLSRGLGCQPWELLRPSLADLGMAGLRQDEPAVPAIPPDLLEAVQAAIAKTYDQANREMFDRVKELARENEALKSRLAAQSEQPAESEDTKLLRKLEKIFGRDGVELLAKVDGLVMAMHLLKSVDPTFVHYELRKQSKRKEQPVHQKQAGPKKA